MGQAAGIEDEFWKSMAKAATAKSWDKEDAVWDRVYAPARRLS